ncbi:MAG: choice-of-anchor J domain-containing protein [Bacteroidales bacterium]|nr:choice-of-anchor J domain-containing protein [Bacteroidales bacterium]
MKRVFTIFAALLMLGSVSFAQSFRVNADKPLKSGKLISQVAKKADKQVAVKSAKTAGDTIATFPWNEGFEAGSVPAGFTFVDGDNDGYGWEVSNFGETTNGNNGSQYVIASASYINQVGALTPDNWMILPSFTIPANSDFELSWYEKGQDANYASEFYSVYITTAGRSVANFTATTPVMSSTSTGNWVKKTVSLSSYAGQTINIAFRHYNVSDMYYLDIDDIRVGSPSAPDLTVMGSPIALLNELAHYSAVTSATTIAWYVDGAAQSSTGINLDYTFTTVGAHQVVAKASNTVGDTYDTLDVNVIDCGTAISTFPYTEAFEAENPCWNFVSADPANDDRTGITSEAYEGNGAFTFSSYSTASDYNQFLISPEITLPAGNQYMVKFWYKGYNANDAFRVRVSTTTNDTAAFTTVLGDNPTVATDWTEVAYTLPAATKYIAINYYGNYAYYLYVDNFSIEEMSAPSVSVTGPESVGTGNEATFVATTNLAESLQWTVDGTADTTTDNVLSTVFTTAGIHTVVCTATNNIGSASDTVTVDVFSCDGITIPYIPDFSESLGCWYNVSDSTADMGWMVSADAFESDPVGQVLSMSAQSFFGMMFDVPVDNWMTSPLIEMPATGTYEIAWKVKPFEPEYAGDHYGVYIVQGEQKTLLFEETLNSNMTDFVQRAIAIPSTVSGDFRVAFRHFNSAGGYVIILDEIQVRALSAPTVTVSGPASVMVGDEATFTADCSNADSYAWTVDGAAQSSTTNTLSVTFTTAGDHTVAVTATNTIGSGSASMTVNAYTCDAVTDFPWREGFEGDLGCWRFVTNSTDNGYYKIENAQYANSGASFILGAYNDDMDVDAWMITPELQLPANAANLNINWYVRLSNYQGLENTYEVLVSTTGSNPSNFTTQLFEETGSTDGYVRRVASLADFAGQTVRIAFHNTSVAGGDAMFLDDVSVEDAVIGIDEVDAINLAVYPNPANNVVNVMGEGIEMVQILDVNGRTVLTADAGSINISSLANGVYFVRAITAKGVATQKIVKK